MMSPSGRRITVVALASVVWLCAAAVSAETTANQGQPGFSLDQALFSGTVPSAIILAYLEYLRRRQDRLEKILEARPCIVSHHACGCPGEDEPPHAPHKAKRGRS